MVTSSDQEKHIRDQQHAAGNAAGAHNADLPSLQAKCTHHAPRKRLLTKLQALVTSPKRAYGRTERDGMGAITGALHHHHHQVDNNSKSQPEAQYRERLASDASVRSGSSAGLSPKSPPGSIYSNMMHAAAGSNNAPRSPMSSTAGSPEATHLTSSPVKRKDQLQSPHNILISESQGLDSFSQDALSDTRANNAEGKTMTSDQVGEEIDAPQVLLRPHLKLRIVTWNMHDSLPTGDLTELLGAPSAACDPTSTKARPMPFDPDHVLQPLSSGLDSEAPYHLVVVGGQEVPVGYGGWSAAPNWTETIQRWLSGIADVDQRGGTVPPTPTDPEARLSPSTATGQGAIPPFSPNSLHRQHLDALPSETLILPEDAIDSQGVNTQIPTGPSRLREQAVEVLQDDLSKKMAGWSESLSPTQSQAAGDPPSALMGRSDSGDTTTTERSVLTDRSAQTDRIPIGHGEDADRATLLDEAQPLSANGSQSPYILVTKERLMGIYCSLWIHSSCAHLVQGSSTGTVTAGLLAGKLGNKGAACISLKIVDTRFLFVCAHLAAHSEKSALRQANVKKIKEELVIDTFLDEQERPEKGRLKRGFSLSRPANDKGNAGKQKYEKAQSDHPSRQESTAGMDITELFDHTFWFGDLNFRLDISRLHADFLINEQKFETALTFDQLGPILKDPKGCFQGFAEAPIKFAPSYKYDVLKLKRSKTVQKPYSGSAGLGLTLGERRSMGQILSPTGLASASASRTNLAGDIVDEEDEGDDHSMADRTLASSRVSVSSTFSGFEKGGFRGEVPTDQETLANTHYNHRASAGFFGTSIPSTPTADKVLDKAKGFFHLIRGRSPAPGANQEMESTSDTHRQESVENGGSLLSPGDTGHADYQESLPLPVPIHGRAQTPTTDGHSFSSARPASTDPSLRRPSAEVSGDHAQSGNLVRSTTPILSPRPRLRSMRSTNTVLSISSIGFGKSVASSTQNQHAQESYLQEATYDTSSKKRVQSWTDRILYKSKVVVEEETSSSHPFANTSLIPSLRGIGKSIRDHAHYRDTQSSAPSATDGQQRVSFQVQEGRDQADREEKIPMYLRPNSSTSSFSDPQQGLNGRLAQLFRRRSSGTRPTTVIEDSVGPADMAVERDSSVNSPPASNGAAKLSRARSLQIRHDNSHVTARDQRRLEAVRPVSSPSSSSAEEELSLRSRTKPHRAYTSPLPVPEASSDGPPVTSRPDFRSVQPAHQSLADRAQATASTPASTNMARHGSEPLTNTSPSRGSPEEQFKRSMTFETERFKRSFPFANPFSRTHHSQEGDSTVAEHHIHRDSPEASRKTNISLSHSKTTPLNHTLLQAGERPHLGLRHWFNARLLPHLFSSSADESMDQKRQDPEEDVATPDVEIVMPPAPIVVGPRPGEIQCIYYDSISDLRRMEACSDHRPVVAVFAIGIQ